MPSLVTWNMQGGSAPTEIKWRTGVANMFVGLDPKPDYFCLQEAGQVPGSAHEIESKVFRDPQGNLTEVKYCSWAVAGTEHPYGIAFHKWDEAGNRVNTAIVMKDLLPQPVELELLWIQRPQWRPALGLWTGGSWVYSFHAISPGGADAAGMAAEVARRSGNEAWFLGADFNCEPGTFAPPVGSSLCEPAGPTWKVPSPTKELDYLISTIPCERKGTVVKEIGLSDHYPVWYGI